MKLRPPAVPLITVDPYFSVWSAADCLTDCAVSHWTGKPNTINGAVLIDGVPYRFMGEGSEPPMRQTSLSIDALTTVYTFEGGNVRLTARFFTPLFPDDYELLSRPVSYLELSALSLDDKSHSVSASLSASEELCLDKKGELEVAVEELSIGKIPAVKMGSVRQPVLAQCGDDIRINWGYFYLCVRGGSVASHKQDGVTFIDASAELSNGPVVFAFAYDDTASLVYFGQKLRSYWNRGGGTVEAAIAKAYGEYPRLCARASAFSADLYSRACAAGGEKYAELLSLAYRQVLAAHKLALDEDGRLLYISKECFSNGCAATVDITYPSVPLFLYYNPSLIKGMLRPVFRYAESEKWPFDFAPHDVGTYPHVNGQVYAGTDDVEHQMPVEECGNMLITCAAVAIAERDASFLAPHMETLRTWAEYLLSHGMDPENQLCTDDFAGHLAHNCNLSLKAIISLAAMAQICRLSGEDGSRYLTAAKEMAAKWTQTAANGDGSYRLAFDRPGSFSMKYNLIWDKVFGTGIFPPEVSASEFESYPARFGRYGLPLDNRAGYTKSDWLVWTASFAQTREQFKEFIAPLWQAYHESASRVPLTDWYETADGKQCGFQHRAVQGGLFMKLLLDSGKCRI